MLGEAVLPEYDTLMFAGAVLRGDQRDRCRQASDGVHIGVGELPNVLLQAAARETEVGPGRHGQQVGTQGLEPADHLRLGALAHRHQRDHRATPITTPSMVRKERILCTISDCAATRRTINHFLMCAAPLSARRRTVCP